MEVAYSSIVKRLKKNLACSNPDDYNLNNNLNTARVLSRLYHTELLRNLYSHETTI